MEFPARGIESANENLISQCLVTADRPRVADERPPFPLDNLGLPSSFFRVSPPFPSSSPPRSLAYGFRHH
jgi:hypothetical protein